MQQALFDLSFNHLNWIINANWRQNSTFNPTVINKPLLCGMLCAMGYPGKPQALEYSHGQCLLVDTRSQQMSKELFASYYNGQWQLIESFSQGILPQAMLTIYYFHGNLPLVRFITIKKAVDILKHCLKLPLSLRLHYF